MANFQKAIGKTLILEAGYWDDPRGGPTKYGISQKAYPQYSTSDIKWMAPSTAIRIYERDFWQPVKGDMITNQYIAEELLDTAINCGVVVAVKCVQRALEFLGEGIVIDGKLGSKTLDLINRWCKKNPEALFRAMNGEQYIYYKGIKGISFPAGWMKRLQNWEK